MIRSEKQKGTRSNECWLYLSVDIVVAWNTRTSVGVAFVVRVMLPPDPLALCRDGMKVHKI